MLLDSNPVLIRQLGLMHYEQSLKFMQHHIAANKPKQLHEVWLVEHTSVYSQGQAGKPEHILNLGKIPCIQSDRGGQITFHGPGQLIGYFLFDLERLQLNVRQLVQLTTASVLDFLAQLGIKATDDPVHPGVYTNGSKIASLGFRVKRHMSYHGVAINMQMDLLPFQGINPCGRQQPVTQVADLNNSQNEIIPKPKGMMYWQSLYIKHLVKTFGFDNVTVTSTWP